jgi:hypothetical protein
MKTSENTNGQHVDFKTLPFYTTEKAYDAQLGKGSVAVGYNVLHNRRALAQFRAQFEEVHQLFDKLSVAIYRGVTSITLNTHFGSVTVPVEPETANNVHDLLLEDMQQRLAQLERYILHAAQNMEHDALEVGPEHELAARVFALCAPERAAELQAAIAAEQQEGGPQRA